MDHVTKESVKEVPNSLITLFQKVLRELAVSIIPAILIALFLNVTVAKAVEIRSGPSMQPNLFEGYRLMTESVSYRLHLPQRGDIVVVDRPGDKVTLIKRIIGLPGETIEVRDGHTSIDGHSLEEPWVTYFGGPDYGPEKIPEGYVFILGDNRLLSRDSRAIGPVSIGSIKGRAWLVYWPLSELRFVH